MPAIIILAAIGTLSCKVQPFSIPFLSTPASQILDEDENETGTIQSWQVRAPDVEELTGTFTYSNDFWPEAYAYEHAVMLLDMHGFVERDFEWEVPVESQVIGMVDLDAENNSATYRLQLPVKPRGILNDVDQDGQKDSGVQIFAVEYAPNIAQDPFYRGDDRYKGWPGYLASVIIDRENQDEVNGGRLLIWAADADQQFPSGFGADGLLFTADDPQASVPAGYSVVDLDQEPFLFLQDASVELTLYEPADAAVKDFSDQKYSQAFDSMFEIVKKEYAFNGIEGKQPDWEVLYQEISPKVQQAEKDKSAEDFYLALHEFIMNFKDGHVGLDGGEIGSQFYSSVISSGYGFAIRELDDGKVIVVYVSPDSAADMPGIKEGTEITAFNGEPIGTAIGKTSVLEPQSTDFAMRYQQARYLLRAPLGTTAAITYLDPASGESREAILEAVEEYTSFSATSLFNAYDPNVLPVEYQILDSGIGYVRVNSNYDDLNLIKRLFERALIIFEQNQVEGIIIDMRLNFGGSPLDLAGFLTEDKIPLGQLEYYSDQSGEFEADGPPSKLLPSTRQFSFPKMALLVDQSCYSACEIEAYAFSQVRGMEVFGMYPTAGVEAETARGQFLLPEDFSLTIPTGRFTLPDGSIFLEGVGVQPTVRIPIDEETVLSEEDLVLQEAEAYILK